MKTETKYTKGPWKVLMGNYGTYCSINKDTSCRVAEIHIPEGINREHSGRAPITEAHHNAYLIAAAPELYEALTTIFDKLNELSDEMPREQFNWYTKGLFNLMNNAINKAKNE
jgi:hypothetical protein